MILLITIWIFVMKKGGSLNYKQHVAEMMRVAEEQLVEMKKTNESIARIEGFASNLTDEVAAMLGRPGRL
ncbi:MAG: hypothetical protein H7332_13625 [Bdellovibrionales bacterium]|nr:hypothetical protein [Ramlibacter sp.]